MGRAFTRRSGGLILLGGSLAFGVGRTALAVVLARGFPNRLVVVGLAVVPASLVAYVLVLPTAGATGAAVVSTCSYLVYALIGVGFMRARQRASTFRRFSYRALSTSMTIGSRCRTFDRSSMGGGRPRDPDGRPIVWPSGSQFSRNGGVSLLSALALLAGELPRHLILEGGDVGIDHQLDQLPEADLGSQPILSFAFEASPSKTSTSDGR